MIRKAPEKMLWTPKLVFLSFNIGIQNVNDRINCVGRDLKSVGLGLKNVGNPREISRLWSNFSRQRRKFSWRSVKLARWLCSKHRWSSPEHQFFHAIYSSIKVRNPNSETWNSDFEARKIAYREFLRRFREFFRLHRGFLSRCQGSEGRSRSSEGMSYEYRISK